MKKRELLKLPELLVTEEMKEAVRTDEGYNARRDKYPPIWVPKYTWFYRAQRIEDVLEIAIFTRQSITQNTITPIYRVFLHDGKYDTYENGTKKWRKSTIEKLEYAHLHYRPNYYYYSERGIWMPEDERNVLLEYTDNEIKDPMAAVQHWQNSEKNRSELDRINAEMRLVPEPPEDFDDWILTDGLPQYCFYDAGRNVKEGYCTACKAKIPIKKPKYNQELICQNCNRKLIYKSRKKSGNIVDWGYVGLLQKTAEGFVYRYFVVKAKYEHGIRTEGGCWEEVRQMYDEKFRQGNEFEFAKYKQTDMIRWCYKDWNCWYQKTVEHQVILYWDNIEEVTKGTVLEYSALKEFAKQKIKFYPEHYISRYKAHPGIEQLVKCGFYKLAKATLNEYERLSYADLQEKSCKKILGLRNDYYRLLAGTDPSVGEYVATWEMQEVSVRASREEIAYLSSVNYSRNFAIYIRHTTTYKMIRYLKECLDSDRDTIREYHDYLQLAAGLGYNLDDEFILFPKKLQERHGQYVEERRELDLKIKQAEDDEKLKMFLETIKKKDWGKYEMETETLLIRLPKTPSEIRSEGNSLHHCVSTYIDRMVGGKTCILFIRDKTDAEKSFYTMEVANGKIVQCRGKYNCDMTDEVKACTELFKKKKLQIAERMAG